MKKLLSLSLVASATILSLNASAQDLSEAIKNVDVSGTVAYRYNDYESSSTNTVNNYKVALSLKSKVNDDVSFNSRFLIEAFNMDTSSSPDSNPTVKLSEANFTYTGVENATLTVGKQGIDTPFTVARDAMGDETTGTGAVATYTFAPVTFAAAYFNQTDLTNGYQNIATVGLMGSISAVNFDAWYIDVDNAADAYTIGLSADYKISDVAINAFARYSDQDNDNATSANDEVSTLKIGFGATAGIFDAFLGYGKTGKDAGVNLDGNSAATTYDEHWRVGLFTQADSDILFANVGAQLTDTVHVALKHTDLDRPNATADEEETYAQVTYSMSSNLTTYVRFGNYEKDGQEDQTSGRLHVQYSF